MSSSDRMDEYMERLDWAVNITTTDAFDDVDKSIRNSYGSDGWRIVSDNKSLIDKFMLVIHSDDYILSINYDNMGDSVVDIHYGLSAKAK